MAKMYKKDNKTGINTLVADAGEIYFWKSQEGVSIEIRTGKYHDIHSYLRLTKENIQRLLTLAEMN